MTSLAFAYALASWSYAAFDVLRSPGGFARKVREVWTPGEFPEELFGMACVGTACAYIVMAPALPVMWALAFHEVAIGADDEDSGGEP